jgi:hypothetical protein
MSRVEKVEHLKETPVLVQQVRGGVGSWHHAARDNIAPVINITLRKSYTQH